MQHLIAILPGLIIFGTFLSVLAIGITVSLRQRRRSRRRILADGRSAEAVISEIAGDEQADGCLVQFRFQPDIAGPQLEGQQVSTWQAMKSLGLTVGSKVRVYYLPKWPRDAFIKTLAVAERISALNSSGGMARGDESLVHVHFISYDSRANQASKSSRWSGDGTITVGANFVRLSGKRTRPFRFSKSFEQQLAREVVRNVEVFDNVVRFEIAEPNRRPRPLQFQTISADEAKAIGSELPSAKTPKYAPQLAERAAFDAHLKGVSPRALVTPVLIGINCTAFIVTALLGGGIFVPNGEVLIRLGSDYTPLTAAGEWWRLLTSTFLHFGFAHLAFNMWALWVNGVLVERLYGSSRYLLLYLVAGIAGSISSFLWHPFANGAGASGAIFGVLGAMFAYFLRTDSGVPASVLNAQRNAVGLFIIVSLANASRVKGIDNAAHVGGLVTGFLWGLLLWRPLDAERDKRAWSIQWACTAAVLAFSVVVVGYELRLGRWRPRVLHDASGRPIQFAELMPAPHSFGGVVLGMTSEELLRARGPPLKKEGNDWIYDSIDAAHSGVLDVFFTAGTDGHPPTVWAIRFWGRPNAEPAGIANLLQFTRQDLVMRYGSPWNERNVEGGTKHLFFQNGLLVSLDATEKVFAYGMYAKPQQPPP